MPLRLLPDLVWPITSLQIQPLQDNLVQLNLIEANLNQQQQKALAILFAISDRWVKSKGKLDYRGHAGHQKLQDEAAAFVGATPIVTRHGDLAASHLAIDYHDAQVRLLQVGMPLLSNDREVLLNEVHDFVGMSVKDLEQNLVLLDFLNKRPMPIR